MRCPYCQEEISDNAKKCKFCGEWIRPKNFKDSFRTAWSFILPIITLISVSLLLYNYFYNPKSIVPTPAVVTDTPKTDSSKPSETKATAESFAELVKKANPAVVTIITYDERGKKTGLGSGFFINKDGHLITNYHVVDSSEYAIVRLFDHREFKISPTNVISRDKKADLIKIAVPITGEVPGFLEINSNLPEVGERIIVMGNPLGLEQTISDGVVSAIRNLEDFGDIIQISAPVSPGSSGGPVMNLKGEVVGVATAMSRRGQNLNFAMPSSKIIALQTAPKKTTLVQKKSEPAPGKELDIILGVIKDYFAKVEKSEIDDAINLYAIEKRPKIKRHILETTARHTEYYQIEKMIPIYEGSQNTKVLVYLYHKKYNSPVEYWEITMDLVKDNGEWRILRTSGKRLR